jgi:hypothetical protein
MRYRLAFTDAGLIGLRSAQREHNTLRMPAPEGGAFDASTGFGRDERRHGGRVGGQRAQALIGAPCPEDGEVAAVGALGRHGLLCTREVGGAVERVAGRLLSATVKAGTCMFILGLGIRSAKQSYR